MKHYQHREYLRMVFEGLSYNIDYLSEFLTREQKKAEMEGISFSEFIGRTITVIQDLETQLRLYRRGKKEELEAQKNGENDNSIDQQIRLYTDSEDLIQLSMEAYSEEEFSGLVTWWHTRVFRDAIKDAFDFNNSEDEEVVGKPMNFNLGDIFNLTEIESKPIDEETTITDEKKNPYPEVFKSTEGFLLFHRLYESKKDSKTLLADFSFIYRRMWKDNYLQDHQKPEVFRHWLSKEPYKVDLDNKFKTLNICTTNDKEYAYFTAKQLVLSEENN